MLISGILFIIIGLLILVLTIIKTVKMMKADSNAKIEKYNNTYETFTEVNTSKYNDIDHRARNRYFKGTTQGIHMESGNPTIIKTWLFGFGTFWFILGTGVHLIVANFTGVNIVFIIMFFIFVVFPFLFSIIKGFSYNNKEQHIWQDKQRILRTLIARLKSQYQTFLKSSLQTQGFQKLRQLKKH